MAYEEITWEERNRMMVEGVFDTNGNLPAHPAYTGVHVKQPTEEEIANVIVEVAFPRERILFGEGPAGYVVPKDRESLILALAALRRTMVSIERYLKS